MPLARTSLPLDEETVHESHRQLRAALFWFRLRNPGASVPDAATSLRHAMGRIRDVDVAVRELRRSTLVGGPRVRSAEVRSVVIGLREEARRRRNRLRTFLRDHPEALLPLSANPSHLAPRLVNRARTDALARLRRAHHRALASPTRRRLHQVRKRIREIGLLNQEAHGGDPTGVPRLGPELAGLAHRLGRLNDRATLIRWISRRIGGPEAESLLEELRAAQRRARGAAVARLGRIRQADWRRWATPLRSDSTPGRRALPSRASPERPRGGRLRAGRVRRAIGSNRVRRRIGRAPGAWERSQRPGTESAASR